MGLLENITTVEMTWGNFTRILPEGPQKMANDAWKV